MSNPITKRSTPTTLPEFMTSPSVADYFMEWLDATFAEQEAAAREAGTFRAEGWKFRTLSRAREQFRPIVTALTGDETPAS